MGQNPGDLTGRVEDLIYLLSGQRPGFAGIEAATAMLVDLLVDRDILIVIDDVWDAAHLRPFVQGGSRCARVITTRVVDAVPVGASRVDVDAMRQDEALALVGHGLADGFDAGLARSRGAPRRMAAAAEARQRRAARPGAQRGTDASPRRSPTSTRRWTDAD